MKQKPHYVTVDRHRRAGVLLHPTSLPGTLGNGDIGHEAYRFIEFLSSAGFKVWQMLPLGPTHNDKSPYQCLSAHAGSADLISLDWLVDRGWLDTVAPGPGDDSGDYRARCLRQASDYFYTQGTREWHARLEKFRDDNRYWLDDYALFMAFKYKYQDKPWYEWPKVIRHRDSKQLHEASVELKDIIRYTEFEQFVFFYQWHEIREYARSHGIELFGDIPIFVARDSADVWAYRENFLMDSDGEMAFVAGVPPDALSDSGQRWGNPLYDWDYMEESDFGWWVKRFQTQLALFDMVRIDHFRGLQACWQIPGQDDTAINGNWVEVPGRELLEKLFSEFTRLPLIAEDLGVITDAVIELKDMFEMSGMKVLQFAFDGNSANPHLPHQHATDDVIYTGTHDNDTTLGWCMDAAVYNRHYFDEYAGLEDASDRNRLCAMLRMAFSSVSFLCVLPMQDLLGLGSEARMNKPGTVVGNWQWRFTWEQLQPERVDRIAHLLKLYQR